MASGKPVTSFTVAVNAFNKNRATGQYEKGESTFFRCAVWGDMAENTAESLTKGTRVNVEGRLTVRQYESQGQTRTSLDVVVDEIGPSLRYAKTTITKTTLAAKVVGMVPHRKARSREGCPRNIRQVATRPQDMIRGRAPARHHSSLPGPRR